MLQYFAKTIVFTMKILTFAGFLGFLGFLEDFISFPAQPGVSPDSSTWWGLTLDGTWQDIHMRVCCTWWCTLRCIYYINHLILRMADNVKSKATETLL